MKAAVLIVGCAAALVGCSGIEEIALNPQGAAAGAPGTGGASATSAIGGGGSSSVAGSAGSGGAPSGGVAGAAGHGGVGGQLLTMPSDGGTDAAGCADDDGCPDSAPYCRADSKCVVCLNDSHCGSEDLRCELGSGNCVDTGCAGAGGGEASGGCSSL